MTETPETQPDIVPESAAEPTYMLRLVHDEDGRDMEMQHIASIEGLPIWPPPARAFIFRGRFTYADWVTAQIGYITDDAPEDFLDTLKAQAAVSAAASPFDVVELVIATRQHCSEIDPRTLRPRDHVMPGVEYRITERIAILALNGSGGEADAADPS